MNDLDLVLTALDRLQNHADELRDLDAALGDGDLGVTVRDGAAAVQTELREDDGRSLSQLLLAAGRAFGNANPSTFAALVQGGMLAAAKATRERTLPLSVDDLRVILNSCAESIRRRGGCEAGDKTVLDPLLSSIDALEGRVELTPDVVTAMVSAATETTNDLAQRPASKGRAAWVGERSVGHRDPGSVAYVRFLEALQDGAAAALSR